MRQMSNSSCIHIILLILLTMGISVSRAQPPSEILIDFEAFTPGAQPLNFLTGFGITGLIIDGPPNCGPAILENSNQPPFVFNGTSGTQFFGLNSCTPEPHSVTLQFDPPLASFGFSRISTQGGGSSTPKWLAEALNAAETVLDAVGEATFQVSVPAADFILLAPPGEVIDAVRITSDNVFGTTGFATFNSIPLDDFRLRPTCNGLGATLVGTDNPETLVGTSGDDVIVGLGGNDILRGMQGNDTLCGGDGDDLLRGGRGDDTIFGEGDNDVVSAGNDNDTVYGGPGNDQLHGGGGNDLLLGGEGDDELVGAAGLDPCEDDPADTILPVDCETPVFVTSQPYDGNLGNLSGADDLCQDHAEGAGLPGVYVAWLGDSGTDAKDRIPQEGPYQLVDGTPIAQDLDDLLDGDLDAPIDLSETGTNVVAKVWTSTFVSGLSSVGSASGDTGCNDWSTNSSEGPTGLNGSTGAQNSQWTADGVMTCDMQNRLYCFGGTP